MKSTMSLVPSSRRRWTAYSIMGSGGAALGPSCGQHAPRPSRVWPPRGTRRCWLEKELIQLREIVEFVLPASLGAAGCRCCRGHPLRGTDPSFKAVVRVREKYEDPVGTAGWVYMNWGRESGPFGTVMIYTSTSAKPQPSHQSRAQDQSGRCSPLPAPLCQAVERLRGRR